mmetsp:Transcript_19536/g.33576  ORF Transcript_19536/g.33576 Transcript_19536/m.33576 type:complete len:84 (-) Transcript_19536:29-280(-)
MAEAEFARQNVNGNEAVDFEAQTCRSCSNGDDIITPETPHANNPNCCFRCAVSGYVRKMYATSSDNVDKTLKQIIEKFVFFGT